MNTNLCMNCVYFDEKATGPHCIGCIYDLNHPHYVSRYKRPKDVKIKKMILNPPAAILIFDDDTKTVVKCMPGDNYDPEKGVALAMLKKLVGPREYRQILKDVKELVKEGHKKEIEEAKKTLEAENRVRLEQAEILKKLKDNGVRLY